MINLVFDYDGTIHETLRVYAPAFRKAVGWLESEGHIPRRDYSDEEIGRWLGYNSEEMWQAFQPGLSPQLRERARIMLGEEMKRRIGLGEGALYPGAEQALTELKDRGYRLIILSNCRVAYMELHRRVFGLDRFFSAYYPCEKYGFAPKWEIFRTVAAEAPGEHIIIGDRFHDIETAAVHGLRAIGCGYGYGEAGELEKADIVIDDISELTGAVEKIRTRLGAK